MRFPFRNLTSIALSAALASAMLLAGCSAHLSTGYRVHDGYHNDDHAWDDTEMGYYGRWENETHRHHEDFRRRSADEQREYWNWRHNLH
jgi:hypothetical protein